MTEQEQKIIEKYLANDLSEAERMAFEQELAGNSDLRHDLEGYRNALMAIRLKGREQIRQRWPTQNTTKIQPYLSAPARVGISVLVGILLVVVITWIWRTHSTSPGHQNDILSDTLETKPIPQMTAPVTAPDSVQEHPTVVPDISAQRSKLFATYFRLYRDETMNPTVRGAADRTALERFQRLYWDGRYAEALTTYETLDPVLREHDNMLFLKANLFLATDKTNQSLALFKHIVQQDGSRYSEEARWYEALCYIKKGNWPAAQKSLSHIAATEGASHRKEAEQVLKQLE